MTLRKSFGPAITLCLAWLCSAPLYAEDAAPQSPTAAEPVTTAVATPDAPPPAPPPPPIESNDPRLSRGTYALYVGDVNRIMQIPAQIGFINGVLYFMTPPSKSKAHDSARDQNFIIPATAIKGVGLKKLGLNRQIHLDLGLQRAVFVLSGAVFVNRKGTDALYAEMVAAGIPTFKPERFIQAPPTTVILVQ
ncbi:hypothetical protein [Ahniella affigens]|nr:hypothetical protein [Ahniella affigens]